MRTDQTLGHAISGSSWFVCWTSTWTWEWLGKLVVAAGAFLAVTVQRW